MSPTAIHRPTSAAGRCLTSCAWLLAAALLCLGLAACGKTEAEPPAQSQKAADPYDSSKMVYGGPPATLSTVRHTGAYAVGDALSFDAAVKPLNTAPEPHARTAAMYRA